jgi:predicted nuclease of predicted toxin-antitoxin system
MLGFLIDEQLPRSLARDIVGAGWVGVHVVDVGLQGHADDRVLRYAIEGDLVLITCDMGFADIRRFPIGTRSGILVGRFPDELSIDARKRILLDAIRSLDLRRIPGNLVVIEPGSVRIRRGPAV